MKVLKRNSSNLSRDTLGEEIGFSLTKVNLKIAAIVGPALFIGLASPATLPIVAPLIAYTLFRRSNALQKGGNKITKAQQNLNQNLQLNAMMHRITQKAAKLNQNGHTL